MKSGSSVLLFWAVIISTKKKTFLKKGIVGVIALYLGLLSFPPWYIILMKKTLDVIALYLGLLSFPRGQKCPMSVQLYVIALYLGLLSFPL